MIVDHKFRNRCGTDCHRCCEEPKNDCSETIEQNGNYNSCRRTRAEHAGVLEGHEYKPTKHGHG